MKERMMELVKQLNAASDAYYGGAEEQMSNKEWDALYDELAALERKTGIVLPDSPTNKVGAEEDVKGKKENHEFPALSLAKTKLVEDLRKWAAGRMIYMSWKLDGLTLVVTYDDGKLSKVVTRGNGIVGTNITHLADAIIGIPEKISIKGHYVVRGEAVIAYHDFNHYNEENGTDYANPRNLASGSLSLDDIDELRKRRVTFIAFNVVHTEETLYNNEGEDVTENFSARLRSWMFAPVDHTTNNIVEHICIPVDGDMEQGIEHFNHLLDENRMPYPVDGLVITYADTKYAREGSSTGHHETRGGFAFKWADETAETVLIDIEWSASATGRLNPVAVFQPVELEGTTVTRASLHNLSYVADKDLRIGDKITVYKANMIIPQVDQNLSDRNLSVININSYINIDKCPVCGGTIGIHESNDTFSVVCTNPKCQAKHIGKLERFCCKDGLNIDGLSSEKLQFLVNHQYINGRADLLAVTGEYELNGYISNQNNIHLCMEDGWGETSEKNLYLAVKNAGKNVDFKHFMYALGIPYIGRGQVKALYEYFSKNEENQGCDYVINLLDMLNDGKSVDFIDGFGEMLNRSFHTWFDQNVRDDYGEFIADPEIETENEVLLLIQWLTFKEPQKTEPSSDKLAGKVFVITGSVEHYANREELKTEIESYGGKVTGSVTSKTSYLINNDITSTSGKNKKAKELGVPIISENEYRNMVAD